MHSSTSSCISLCSTNSCDADDLKNEYLASIPRLLNELGIEYDNLDYLASGTYHIVFTFDWLRYGNSNNNQQDSKNCSTPAVIRIATKEDLNEACEWTVDQAAILPFVRQHFSTVPELLQYDATTNNILGKPWTIQSRLPGQVLDSVWDELGLNAKLKIAEQLGDFLLGCENIQLPQYGYVGGVETPDHCVQLGIRGMDSEGPVEPLTGSLVGPVSLKDHCELSLPEHISHRYPWEYDEEFPRHHKLLEGVGRIVKEMHEMTGYRTYTSSNLNQAVLQHRDLHFGNILVESTGTNGNKEEENWHISGILDWDGICAVPLVLAREQPAFLWQNGLFQNPDAFTCWNGDFIYLPRIFRQVYDEPHGAQIKAHFDTYMQKKIRDVQGDQSAGRWVEDSYGRGKFVRRVVEFSQFGYDDEYRNVAILEELLQEWQETVTEDVAHTVVQMIVQAAVHNAVQQAMQNALQNAEHTNSDSEILETGEDSHEVASPTQFQPEVPTSLFGPALGSMSLIHQGWGLVRQFGGAILVLAVEFAPAWWRVFEWISC